MKTHTGYFGPLAPIMAKPSDEEVQLGLALMNHGDPHGIA